jgi:hypothetical protein
MLPSTLKYLYSVEPVRMHFPVKRPYCTNDTVHSAVCSIVHSIICTVRLFRGKMHSDWFNGMEILQGRWEHGEKVKYCYPSGLERTPCNWDIYIPLVTKGLKEATRILQGTPYLFPLSNAVTTLYDCFQKAMLIFFSYFSPSFINSVR